MKLKLNKIKIFLEKLPRLLEEHAFLTFLGFVIIAAILGGFMFYKYSFLAEKTILEAVEAPVKFDKKLYQKVLEEWKERQGEFKKVDSKTYLDPFKNPFKKLISASSSETLTE